MSTPAASVIFGRTHAPNEQWLAKAQPEAALQPDLPIVDTYVHFWHRAEHRYFLED